MKKALVLLPAIMALTACGTFNKSPYEQQNDRAREARIDNQEKVVKKAPDWYVKPPKFDNSAYYAVGTYSSGDLFEAESVATNRALGTLCVTVAGEISKVDKTTMISGKTLSESAIRVACAKVPVMGYVLQDKSGFVDNRGDYRSYVLVALPQGEANQLYQHFLNNVDMKSLKKRADELQRETASQ
jgi:hypothetical protein